MSEARTAADGLGALEQRAAALRQIPKVPLPTGQAHARMWTGRGENGNAYLEGQRFLPGFQPMKLFPPASMDDWLAKRSLKKGDIQGDGRCQYRAVSRALFGDELHHEELKSLAVEFLRLRKSEFYESAVSEINARKESLAANGNRPSYEGWCNALDRFQEWGNDFTLTCMCWLMRVEIRVVTSMARFSEDSAPRIMLTTHDPTDKAGPPRAVIYLALEQYDNQNDGAAHYSTIEGSLSQAAVGATAMDTASHVSLESGSRYTNYSALGEEMVDGEEHSIIELMTGVGYGDGEFKKVAIQDKESRCFKIYKMHLRTGAQELLRTVPYMVTHGPPKVKPHLAAPCPPGRSASSTSDDVMHWQQKLAEGPTATRDLAQKMTDLISDYIERVGLTKSAPDDECYIDRLGAKMYHLKERAQSINVDMYCHAYSEAQDPFKIVVVGVEGSGKSTMVNSLLRRLMQTDDKLADAYAKATAIAGASAEQPNMIRDTCSRLYATEKPDLQAKEMVNAAEAMRSEKIFDTKKGPYKQQFKKMNKLKDDVLPTGEATNALTALATMIEFKPDVSEVTLKLTYRSREEVDEVLEAAEAVRIQIRAQREARKMANGDDDEPELELGDGRDVALMAHMACAMLNISTSSGDAEMQLANYEGPFELPPHFMQLLGRERCLTIAAGTGDGMLGRLNKWLMLHTVGTWSHWGVVRSVECVLPSRDDLSIKLCDVPGFGMETANPFRQSIVTDALTNCECSTFLICLKWRRLDGENEKSASVLNKNLGVYESLIGEELERRVGQVVTVQALDYAKQTEILTKQDLEADDVESDGNEMACNGQTWLEQNFRRDLRGKGIADERILSVLDKFTRSFAIDVRGELARHLRDKDEPEELHENFSIGALVESLKSANRDALRRRQQLCFQRLVAEVMLPFYEEHAKLGKLRQMQRDDDVKLPTLKRVLVDVQDAGNLALMGSIFEGVDERSSRSKMSQQYETRGNATAGATSSSVGSEIGQAKVCARTAHEANSNRSKVMLSDIESQLLHTNHMDGQSHGQEVKDRYHHDNCLPIDRVSAETGATRFPEHHFAAYRKPRSRQLGKHLKSQNPHMTLLSDLLMPEVSRDLTVRLQEHLRSIKPDLIEKPVRAMVSRLELRFKTILQQSKIRDQLEMVLSSSLRKWRDQELRSYDMQFAELLQTILEQKELIMKDVMIKDLKRIGISFSANLDRVTNLARKASCVAYQIAEDLVDYVLRAILDVLHMRLFQSFEACTRGTYSLMEAATKSGDMQELERLDAYPASQKFARSTAGLIKAVHQSKMGRNFVKDYQDLDGILKLADQPALDGLTNGVGLQELYPAPISFETPPVPSLPAAGPDVHRLGWSCPGCQCPETQSPIRKPLDLIRPHCRFRPHVCFCESIDLKTEYCSLCVRYYKNKSAQLKQCTLRTEQHERARASSKASYNKRKRWSQGEPSEVGLAALKAPKVCDVDD